jgi:2-polyprenyl-6-methoxyphenol hydroxylase-like FAD-dependent oxidoreductase
LDKEEIRSQEQERYKDVFAPVPQIIEATNNFFAWDIYELPPLGRWSRGSVVLIGDAAHALPPNKGQGVSQAIEDVFVLARVVEQGRVLERYAEIRKPRVEKLREEFVMQRKEEERGPWAQWFRMWAFWGFLKVTSWWRWVSGWDPFAVGFGYDPDEVEI